jgi:hypothetical protein
LGDRVELRLRTLHRHARPQSAKGQPLAIASIFQSAPRFDPLLHHAGNPELRSEHALCSGESRRSDANDSEGMVVYLKQRADNSGFTAEALLPASIRKHNNRVRIGPALLVGGEGAAQERLHAEDVKIVRGDQVAPHALVVSIVAQAQRIKAVHGHG